MSALLCWGPATLDPNNRRRASGGLGGLDGGLDAAERSAGQVRRWFLGWQCAQQTEDLLNRLHTFRLDIYGFHKSSACARVGAVQKQINSATIFVAELHKLPEIRG